jgi:mannose-6-phosphate isomerase-like protein (cupin superfamily)
VTGRTALLATLLVISGATGCGATKSPAPATPSPERITSADGVNRAVVMRRDSIQAVTGGAPRRQFVRWTGASRTAAYAQEETGAAGEAEVHLGADDYHHIISGRVRFALGGTLVAPRETRPGEWRARSAANADTIELHAGDVLFVPRGTMHQRLAGAPYTVLVTKVYVDSAAPRSPVPPR